MTRDYYPCQSCNGTGYTTQIERGEQEVYVCETCGGPAIHELEAEDDDDGPDADDDAACAADSRATGSIHL